MPDRTSLGRTSDPSNGAVVHQIQELNSCAPQGLEKSMHARKRWLGTLSWHRVQGFLQLQVTSSLSKHSVVVAQIDSILEAAKLYVVVTLCGIHSGLFVLISVQLWKYFVYHEIDSISFLFDINYSTYYIFGSGIYIRSPCFIGRPTGC